MTMNDLTVPHAEAPRHEPLERVFAPLIGLPAWCVRKGYGSMLTLEFGQPHLRIREPIVCSETRSEQVRTALQRRQVHPVGYWQLQIYCCNWRVLSNGQEIAWSEAPDEKIVAAAKQIDGQLLISVTAKPATGTSEFRFDQGVYLKTWPYNAEKDEQWLLFKRSGAVFTYRADGHYHLGLGNAPVEDKAFQPLV